MGGVSSGPRASPGWSLVDVRLIALIGNRFDRLGRDPRDEQILLGGLLLALGLDAWRHRNRVSRNTQEDRWTPTAW